MVNFEDSVCLVVTGAGRGYGRALCLAVVPHMHKRSVVILLGRSKDPLEQTKLFILQKNSSVTVYIYDGLECSSLNEDSLSKFVNECVPALSSTHSLLILHNCGTVGKPSLKGTDYKLLEANQYMLINFSSMVAVNNILLKQLSVCAQKTVVNISSLCAVQPSKGLSLYCAGKAARDMFFRVAAEECLSVRFLNYAPGPMETDMLEEIQSSCYDDVTRDMFKGIQCVKMEDSAAKLVTVLREDKFVSGSHVDYFDPLPS